MVNGASPFLTAGPVFFLVFSLSLSSLMSILAAIHIDHIFTWAIFLCLSIPWHTALLGSMCQLIILPCWLRKFLKMVGRTIQALPGGGILCSVRKFSQMVGRTKWLLPWWGSLRLAPIILSSHDPSGSCLDNFFHGWDLLDLAKSNPNAIWVIWPTSNDGDY